LILDRLDEVSDERVKVLGEIERDKLRVARAYNKKVKEKSFQVGDLIWKTILPMECKSNKFGKWSSNWERPYRIDEVIPKKFLYGSKRARNLAVKGAQQEVLEKVLY
jgi:hypothetical protein